jgi:hypothetical protein
VIAERSKSPSVTATAITTVDGVVEVVLAAQLADADVEGWPSEDADDGHAEPEGEAGFTRFPVMLTYMIGPILRSNWAVVLSHWSALHVQIDLPDDGQLVRKLKES